MTLPYFLLPNFQLCFKLALPLFQTYLHHVDNGPIEAKGQLPPRADVAMGKVTLGDNRE